MGTTEPFLCIITPIFDPALKSLKGLVSDLQQQTYRDFLHINIANGKEEKIRKYIDKVRVSDKRFVYDEIPFCDLYKESGSVYDLLIINGMRRNFVMRKYDAKRYLNLGADFQMTDPKFIERLFDAHIQNPKDIILLQTILDDLTFPLYPINKHRHIDLTNFCYSKKIARKVKYPEDIDLEFDISNDYRYFDKIANFTLMEGSYGTKDGRTSYKTIEDLYNEKEGLT